VARENKIAGIVLSGGKSNRMGRDKGFCLLNGKSLVGYAIDVLKEVCFPILISANSVDYKSFGYPVIRDKFSDIGPLGGIYSSLLKSSQDLNFILSCDMPLISPDLVHHIISERENHQVVIPMFNGFPEPLCAFYKKEIIDRLLASIQTGVYKIQDVVKGLDTKYLKIDPSLEFYHEDLFANVNEPHELFRIEKLIKNSKIDEG